MNKVILNGNTGMDIDVRFGQNGGAVGIFRMATNEAFKNKEGEIKERTEWHRCVIFGPRAESLNGKLNKGSKVTVEGRLQTRTFEDQEGVERAVTEIVVQRLEVNKFGSGQAEAAPAASQAEPPAPEPQGEDVPF